MANKAEHKFDRELDRDIKIALRGFKPVFGNDTHVQIMRGRGRIFEMEAELKKKLEAQKGGQKLSEELLQAKRNLLWLLKQTKP